MGILRFVGWTIPQLDVVVQIGLPRRGQACEEASDILQQPLLIFVDGDGRGGVTGGHGQESAGQAAVRNQATDLRRDVVQGDAGVGRNREDVVDVDHRANTIPLLVPTRFRPVGPLELSLVEKIAFTLWRQRRLVHAETATIELETNPRRIASEVESGMGFSGYGDEKIRPEDLQPSDREQAEQSKWYQAVIAEYHQSDALGLDDLGKKAPMIHAQLAGDAEAENKTVPEYLSGTTLEDYVVELVNWCH